MDASKAFDRLNHGILFDVLIKRKIPLYIVRIIHHWYTRQRICVRWGTYVTKFFSSSNGVRQGGILSPKLFNIYMDRLSNELSSVYIGCILKQQVINHLIYADNIVIFSPSIKGLQCLVHCGCLCKIWGKE